MPLTVGSRLGPYEILATAGTGGMGEVYRARDTRLNRTVAVKILSDRISQSAALKERFTREARAISSLNHSHICALHDIGCQDGTDFLILEYLEGETLATRLARGLLLVEDAIRYGGEIASALAEAHRHGIVHRDVKPANVMLTRSGAKLMDFGLARLTGADPEADPEQTNAITLTQEGTVLGTPQYMAPEQVEGAESNAQSDIFAFGAVLYEMIAGQKAFPGDNAQSIASAILLKDPQPVTAFQPATPPELERLIANCLAKDPQLRWQSAQDVKLQLAGIRGNSMHEPRRPLAARQWIPWAVAVAAIAILVAGWS